MGSGVRPDGEPERVEADHLLLPTDRCPDSGAQVTADDLVGFAQAVRAGQLLSAELTEQFLTPQVLHHERDDWAVWHGFGLEFVIDRAGMVRNTYKDGANAGASEIVRYYLADQLDLVVLSTRRTARGRPSTRSTG